ncbi:hypothetical protein F0358_05275 [Empedobacter brevis]|uniref:hypothetical protein n=1 Tax=Empedobacter brevis TaxID=247 RepID=UPI00123D5D3C|nr:hypothetical protein [Empedobacter brevis]QES92171.1 hypothetical protein F0358_05275 [Empedobacter brevis]
MEKQQQSYTEKSTLKNWFSSKLKPTQGQFWAWMDSYWHKGEKLPINTIDGLGEAVDGKAPLVHYHEQYATNDASSLADDNVLSWKQKLGVDDLDYVEIPTENATENSHPYVVVINDEGKSAKRNANDFGKVDTVNEIEPDENKNVNLGLDDVLSKGNTSDKSIKLESSTSTESFTSTYSNGWLSFSRTNNNILVPKYTSSFAAEYFELNQKNQDNSGGISATLRPGYLLLRDFSTTTGRTENSIQYTEKTISLSKSKFVNDVDVTNKIELALDPSFGSINPGDSNANFTAYLQKKSGTLAYLSDLTNVFNLPTNWTHPQQRFSGIVDKSADATYNIFPVLDSNGNLAKASKPFFAFKNFLTQCTIAESTELGQLLNGGQGSSGAISVNLISPPIVQNRFDSTEYVLLRGANLLLNSTDMSISICDADKNVIQEIPNNQIINNSSTELIFYYNFYQFAIGTYYIKITSGVKVYYTTLDLRVVQEVEDINFNEITWEKMYAEDVVSPNVDEAINQNIIQRAVSSKSNTTNVLSSFKSSELFGLGENFSIEYMLTLNQNYSPGTGSYEARVFVGLGYSITPNALINSSIIYHHVSGTGTNFNQIGINGTVYNSSLTTPHNTIVTITKVGNLFRITIGSTTRSFTLSNNSGYCMFIQSNGSAKALEQQIQITKAFKFN